MGQFGTKYTHGMGIKGNGERWQAEINRSLPDLTDDPTVPTVDTIEVADGGDHRAEVRGQLSKRPKNLHEPPELTSGAISNSILRPS